MSPTGHVSKALIDTNILVYRVDPSDPVKQTRAEQILDDGLHNQSIVIAHQTLIEFMAVVTRPQNQTAGNPLLPRRVASQQAEWLMQAFEIIYPDRDVVVTALRGQHLYGLSWWDAHLWAYAEVRSIPELLSEDFQHGRYYGAVRVLNPFLAAEDAVHELPPMYEVSGR
jgi:predicted nucleic acid-binding protein